jgi:hypothetical protein
MTAGVTNENAYHRTIEMNREVELASRADLRQFPDVKSLSLDQYLQLSLEERRRRDELYWQRLSDPQHRVFLAKLFRMSMRTKKQSVKVAIAAKARAG